MEQKNSFFLTEPKYIFSRTGGDKFIIYKHENNYFATFNFEKIYIISIIDNDYFFDKNLRNKFPLLNNFKCQFNLKKPIRFLINLKYE